MVKNTMEDCSGVNLPSERPNCTLWLLLIAAVTVVVSATSSCSLVLAAAADRDFPEGAAFG